VVCGSEKDQENAYATSSVETSRSTHANREEQIVKKIRKAKLFVFLRQHRHELFDEAFQQELASLYRKAERGQPPVTPAVLALALILEAYTGVSDDEVIEATMMDRRWQLVLDCLDCERAPLAKEPWWLSASDSLRPTWTGDSSNEPLRSRARARHLGHELYEPHSIAVPCGELAASRIRTISWATRSKRSCV
jgi:hypothetical protein